MKNINIAISPCLESSAIKNMTVSIDDLASITSKPEIVPEKHSAMLFNGCSYRSVEEITDNEHLAQHGDQPHTRRITANLQDMHLLILDFDNKDSSQPMYTTSMAEEDLKQYTHIGYTSFSHTDDMHRFRIILPLAKPIPLNDATPVCASTFEQLTEGLTALFPNADKSCFRPNQMFFLPSATPETEHLFKHWVNHGTLFDWSTVPKTDVAPRDMTIALARQKRFISNDYLLPDQELEHTRGSIRVRDIKKRIQRVKCPFHSDRRGTEFVNVTKSGLPFLHCRRCAKTFYMQDPDKPNRLDDKLTQEYILGIDNPYDESIQFQDASDRARINEELSKILKKITGPEGMEQKPWGNEPYSHFIYLPEGSGKSRLAIELAKQGRLIVFTCKSYEQLHEKHAEFSQAGEQFGFRVEMRESIDGVFRRLYKCEVIRKHSINPFALKPINIEATIQQVLEQNPAANPEMVRLRLAWHKSSNYCFPEAIPSQNEPLPVRIVLMTFTMMRVLPSLNCWPDEGTIIWYDDPDRNDLIDLAVKGNREEYDRSTGVLLSEAFYLRPHNQSLGLKTKTYCQVITTTERICLKLAEYLFSQRKESYRIHEDMHNVIGGKITILGTKMVRKAWDGIIPVILSSISVNNSDLILISDGLSTTYNHSNSKGKNELTNFNTVIEISCPHPNEINVLCKALNTPFKQDGLRLTIDVMLDKMHQALGRNSGYRNQTGYEAIVLIDPMHHHKLVNSCRYMVDLENSVIIDRLQSQSRLDKRISDTATPLVAQLEHAINQPDKILLDGRIAKPAIRRVIEKINDQGKLVNYLFRLTLALSTLGCYSFLNPDTKRLTATQRSYFSLSQWVMDTFSTPVITQQVITLHQEHEKE